MTRTQPTTSHQRSIEGTTRQRVAALLGLVALGFPLGHVHPVGEVESDRFGAPVVSDDTAHHELSSGAVIHTSACIACSSFGEKAIPAARSSRLDAIEVRADLFPERPTAFDRAPFSNMSNRL